MIKKKVHIIRSSWIANPVGPSVLLKRISESKKYFRERGFDVSVITNDLFIHKNFEKKESKSDLSIIKDFLKKNIKKLSQKNNLMMSFLIKRTLFSYGKKIISYYLNQKQEVDIIVFDDFYSCYSYFKRNPKTNKKTVLFYHNNGAMFDSLRFYFSNLKDSKLEKELLLKEKFVLKKIDKVVFIANYGLKNFLKIHPEFPEEKTAFFHNGIDDIDMLNYQSINEEKSFKYKLCCVATINERKGQRIIIEALNRLSKEKLSQIQVTFVGDGTSMKELDKLCQNYNLSKNVVFEGVVANNKINDYLFESNIFILMSYEEGLPISIIEALRAGLAVISTRISGIPELVIDGENGILLSPSIEELFKVFDNLDDHDWSKMGGKSNEFFKEKFTFKYMLSNYCAMLENFI